MELSDYLSWMSLFNWISFPMNVLALFIILKVSPKTMDTYKKYLFYHQCSVFYMEFAMCKLVTPVFCSPNAMGFYTGWLDFLPVRYTSTLCIIGIPLCALSSLHAIFYRQQQLLPQSSILKLGPRTTIVFWLLFYIIVAFAPAFMAFYGTYYMDNEELKEHMPQILREAYIRIPHAVYTYKLGQDMIPELILIFFVIGTTVCVVGSYVLFYTAFKATSQLASHLSCRTRHLHKVLMMSMLAQLSLTCTLVGGGIMFTMTPLLLKWTWVPQSWNYYGMLIVGFHNVASTPLLLFTYTPYREFLAGLFRRAIGQKKCLSEPNSMDGNRIQTTVTVSVRVFEDRMPRQLQPMSPGM